MANKTGFASRLEVMEAEARLRVRATRLQRAYDLMRAAQKELRKARPGARELQSLARELADLHQNTVALSLAILEDNLWRPGSYHTALCQARHQVKTALDFYDGRNPSYCAEVEMALALEASVPGSAENRLTCGGVQ